MRISSLALLALAASSTRPTGAASFSERTGNVALENELNEDEAYQSRLMQVDMSMLTRAPTPPSALPGPTPTPTTTPSPTIPGACMVDVKIFCSAAEGIECNKLLPPSNPEDCIINAVYSYRVSNIGTTSMTLNTANIAFDDNDPVSILGSFSKTELAPGDDVFGIKPVPVNLCNTDGYTTTLDVVANTDTGNKCSDTDIYVLEPPLPIPTPSPNGTPRLGSGR